MTDGRNEKAREELKAKTKPQVKEQAKKDIMKLLGETHGLTIAEAKEVIYMIDANLMIAHADSSFKTLFANTFQKAGANDDSSKVPSMPPKPKGATEKQKTDGSK